MKSVKLRLFVYEQIVPDDGFGATFMVKHFDKNERPSTAFSGTAAEQIDRYLVVDGANASCYAFGFTTTLFAERSRLQALECSTSLKSLCSKAIITCNFCR